MSVLFDIEYLKAQLPHTYPFLLIDKVVDFSPHEYLTAVKNVTINEWVFQGHFPEKSIYPGVLLVEGVAQSTIILFQESYKDESKTMDSSKWVLGAIKARFFEAVVPGDQVFFKCVPQKMLSNGSIFLESEVTVNEKTVAKVTLTVGRSQ